MTDQHKIKPYGAWIAIDIAKDFNAVLSETIEGKRQHFRMANSASDHDRFVSYLRTLPVPCILALRQPVITTAH